jgi:hypothetical protein
VYAASPYPSLTSLSLSLSQSLSVCVLEGEAAGGRRESRQGGRQAEGTAERERGRGQRGNPRREQKASKATRNRQGQRRGPGEKDAQARRGHGQATRTGTVIFCRGMRASQRRCARNALATFLMSLSYRDLALKCVTIIRDCMAYSFAVARRIGISLDSHMQAHPRALGDPMLSSDSKDLMSARGRARSRFTSSKPMPKKMTNDEPATGLQIRSAISHDRSTIRRSCARSIGSGNVSCLEHED